MLALIIVIAAVALWMDLPNNPGIRVAGIDRDIETRLGLDLVGGVQALLEADLPEGTEIDAESMRTATQIVENRVNGLGVTEAVVQQAGDNRIVVELPGETDPEKALETIKQTGLLEFVEMDFSPLPAGMIIKTDFATGDQEDAESEKTIPEETVYHTVMTGAVIKNVGVTTGPTGGYEVAFELTDEGTGLFADYTSNNAGKFLGIVLDKEVVSAPRIDEPITEGAGVIRGDFTVEAANALAIQLRYGSLPIPLKIVESRTVGPTLGQDSLSQSLLAGLIGVTIMILFMALYYRIPGVIADVSILIYAIIAFALFRFVPVTLTLPGIAGLMLSTGSALDANILIFERLKEELRNGRRLSQAIDIAWQRAWPSIRDSNIATLITCAILFWFGSSFGATLVKGFSLTLALGVAVSLFAAAVVTRTLLSLILGYFKPTNFERWFGI
jgi:preprotein translocase subunit SecD